MGARTKVTVLEISDLTDDGGKTVIVTDAETGKEVKLPKSQIDFMPGRVVMPIWLARKIFKNDAEGPYA
jgi:hypothetical protein